MNLNVGYLINGIFDDDQKVMLIIGDIIFGGPCKDLARLTALDVQFAEVYRIEVESNIFKVYAKMEDYDGTEDDSD